jgi:hypothetical protein
LDQKALLYFQKPHPPKPQGIAKGEILPRNGTIPLQLLIGAQLFKPNGEQPKPLNGAIEFKPPNGAQLKLGNGAQPPKPANPLNGKPPNPPKPHGAHGAGAHPPNPANPLNGKAPNPPKPANGEHPPNGMANFFF